MPKGREQKEKDKDESLCVWETKLRRYARTELQKAPLTGRFLVSMVRIHLAHLGAASGSGPAPGRHEDDHTDGDWLRGMEAKFGQDAEPTRGLAAFLVSMPPPRDDDKYIKDIETYMKSSEYATRIEEYKKTAEYKRDVAMANDLATLVEFESDGGSVPHYTLDGRTTPQQFADFLFKLAVFVIIRLSKQKVDISTALKEKLSERCMCPCIYVDIWPDTRTWGTLDFGKRPFNGGYYLQPFYTDCFWHFSDRYKIFEVVADDTSHWGYHTIWKAGGAKTEFMHGHIIHTMNSVSTFQRSCVSLLGFKADEDTRHSELDAKPLSISVARFMEVVQSASGTAV
jgi:hypothetical protein